MNEKTPRGQLVAKIKSVSNILVTVSRNPNVDQLAAALGLTFMLDKMNKHATAVFSGEIPSAINFLEPEKIFESAVDSLRDFVISLDKEKADRLRYKVEGDLVKIYITPYKTTISEKDLEFNEGDFNIELVVAIGVNEKEHLDEAITAHGRLLHDATVATITLDGGGKSTFGTINWQDADTSSLSEMIANLADDLSDKENPLLDEQIATALLTGVVAATDQFRNERTSAGVMTLAANLMAKGANQQLIASELSAAGSPPSPQPEKTETAEPPAETSDQSESDTLEIDRGSAIETNDHIAADAEAVAAERNRDALSEAQEQLAAAMADTSDGSKPLKVPDRPTTDGAKPNRTILKSELNTPLSSNTTILSHAVPYAESATNSPLNATVAPDSSEPASVDPFFTPSPAPMINTMPTPSTLPPFAPPSIDLPPPPPPPTPDLGQLPPLPLPTKEPLPVVPPPSITSELPPLPLPTEDAPTPPTPDPMFPPVDTTPTDPTDPTEYQIPN